jgi:hypothetical protein
MKKIRLNTDELEVLSFSTAPVPQSRGTVEAANTGNPCYDTVGYHRTQCVGYPPSYWEELTCGPLVPVTDAAGCVTGYGQPGC